MRETKTLSPLPAADRFSLRVSREDTHTIGPLETEWRDSKVIVFVDVDGHKHASVGVFDGTSEDVDAFLSGMSFEEATRLKYKKKFERYARMRGVRL